MQIDHSCVDDSAVLRQLFDCNVNQDHCMDQTNVHKATNYAYTVLLSISCMTVSCFEHN